MVEVKEMIDIKDERRRLRIMKGRVNDGKTYSFGCFNTNWDIPHFVVKIPRTAAFTDIYEGDVYDKSGNEVSLEDIALNLLRANRSPKGVNAGGEFKKPVYGENAHWYFDYSKDFDSFFKANNLPIPADGKSYGQRITDYTLGNLEQQGLLVRGFADAPVASTNGAPGLAALEQAKRAHAAETMKLQEELDRIKRDKEALEKEKEELAKSLQHEKIDATKLKKGTKELV